MIPVRAAFARNRQKRAEGRLCSGLRGLAHPPEFVYKGFYSMRLRQAGLALACNQSQEPGFGQSFRRLPLSGIVF